jgi:ABC-type Fe3+-siderophore transport system permease subunit
MAAAMAQTPMSDRPPAHFYLIGLSSLALLVVAFVLRASESDSGLASVLGILGALGMFACALIIKRHQGRRS